MFQGRIGTRSRHKRRISRRPGRPGRPRRALVAAKAPYYNRPSSSGPNAEQSRVAWRKASTSQYRSGEPLRTLELNTVLRSISHCVAIRSFSAQASWRA